MSDAFSLQVRALLDRLEPPTLSADFADRLVARAEAMPALPSLPPLRKPGLRRRFALGAAAVGLVGAAAAAAVVPVEIWRTVPVIGDIVELFDRASDVPVPPPARIEPAPATAAASEPAMPQAAPEAEPESRPVAEAIEAPQAVEDGAVAVSPHADLALPSGQLERTRVALPQPVRDAPVADRPIPVVTRETAAAVTDTRAEAASERLRPADTSETRQQIRERSAAARRIARERMERRERRTSRAN